MDTQPPIELSEQNLRTLCNCLEAGLPRRLAANAIALLEQDLQRWIDAHPAREAILGTAEAIFHRRCIEIVLSAGERNSAARIRSIMKLLEARFPEQYIRKSVEKIASKTAQPQQPSSLVPPWEPLQPNPANSSTPQEEGITAAAPVASRLVRKIIPMKPAATPTRNETCPCRSGFKYKHCCGAANPGLRRTGARMPATSPEKAAA